MRHVFWGSSPFFGKITADENPLINHQFSVAEFVRIPVKIGGESEFSRIPLRRTPRRPDHVVRPNFTDFTRDYRLDSDYTDKLAIGPNRFASAALLLAGCHSMSNPLPNDQEDRLGPAGEDCASVAPSSEVPAGIDSQQDGAAADSDTAELQQQADKRDRHERRAQKRQEIRADLQFMASANRQAGGRGVYVGFRFVRTSLTTSPDEEPYVGAILPLNVAREFPKLMAFTTVRYEDVFVNEEVEPGTRMVVRPDQFAPYRNGNFTSSLTSPRALLVYAFVTAVVLLGLAVWLTG